VARQLAHTRPYQQVRSCMSRLAPKIAVVLDTTRLVSIACEGAIDLAN
jgi:hypothetical protein